MDPNRVIGRSATRGFRYVNTSNPTVPDLNTGLGLIKSPVSTTALQVVTRVIQVWMVWYSFPESTATSHAYFSLLLAWSIADTIRYLYLALNMHGKSPNALVWLRYVEAAVMWNPQM
jgi:very-long-chain (3R)-3-hydroxyacyl-CoA dehydratase